MTLTFTYAGKGLLLAILFSMITVLVFSIWTVPQVFSQENPDDTENYQEFFAAHLSGESEIPPVQTNADGELALGITEAGQEQEITYTLRVLSAENVTAAHLHCTDRNEQIGPPVATLFDANDPIDVNGVLAEGVITQDDIIPRLAECESDIQTVPHLIQALQEGQIYANVHSIQYPDGLIRGSLEHADAERFFEVTDRADEDRMNDDQEEGLDENMSEDGTMDQELPRVEDIDLAFEDGSYALTGTVIVPSPCYILSTDISVADSSTVRINLTTERDENEVCAQVLTEREFTQSFEAEGDANISLRLNGELVSLPGNEDTVDMDEATREELLARLERIEELLRQIAIILSELATLQQQQDSITN